MGKEVPDFTASQLSTLQHLNSVVHEEPCHCRDLPMIMVKNPTRPRCHAVVPCVFQMPVRSYNHGSYHGYAVTKISQHISLNTLLINRIFHKEILYRQQKSWSIFLLLFTFLVTRRGNDYLCSGGIFHSILKCNRNSIYHSQLH